MVKRYLENRVILLKIICSVSGIVSYRRNDSIIARGAADLAYKRIEPFLLNYMVKVFEEICKLTTTIFFPKAVLPRVVSIGQMSLGM